MLQVKGDRNVRLQFCTYARTLLLTGCIVSSRKCWTRGWAPSRRSQARSAALRARLAPQRGLNWRNPGDGEEGPPLVGASLLGLMEGSSIEKLQGHEAAGLPQRRYGGNNMSRVKCDSGCDPIPQPNSACMHQPSRCRRTALYIFYSFGHSLVDKESILL
jgi:hypothetical protein